MTDKDKQLLAALDEGTIAVDSFLESFSVDITIDIDFVRTALKRAVVTAQPDEIQRTLELVWLSGNTLQYVDILNELLVNPNHRSHQYIAKRLQDDAPSPTTVPFVRKALESNFDYLEYTYSDTGVIAKWFSWLLYAIGTKEAIDLMKEYSHSDDEGIRNEMIYRHTKVHG